MAGPGAGLIERTIAAGTGPGASASIRRSYSWDGPELAAWFEVRADGGRSPSPDPVVVRCVDAAIAAGVPVVGVLGDVDIPADDVAAVAAWGAAHRSLARASGVVPIALILDGAVTGLAALALGLADVVVTTPEGRSHVSSSEAIRSITGRQVDGEGLGGPEALARAGVVHHQAGDLGDAVDWVDAVLGHLPPNSLSATPTEPPTDPPSRRCPGLRDLVPHDQRRGYDVRAVIAEVVDDRHHLEVAPSFGRAMVCALARLGGTPVGIVANQPAHLAGAIDIPSSQKAARFVNWCDTFGLPVVTLVDTPGYLPGRDVEWEGIIRHGGQLAFAYAGATCPRVSLVLRKAFGGAYIVMDSKTMGNDAAFAWPGCQLAVMGAAGAVQILHGRALAEDHDGSVRAVLEAEYAATHLGPADALRRALVDDVIDPADTRAVLCGAVASLRHKRPALPDRRHSNGPL